MSNFNHYHIIATTDHPLYQQAKKMNLRMTDYGSIPDSDYIVDLCLIEKSKKIELLENLKNKKVISDLTCHNGEKLMKSYNNIVGAMAAGFMSPTNACEVVTETQQEFIKEFLEQFEIKAIAVKSAGIGFNYPRIISMIINEAYFAKEEKVAEETAIDTAMLYGVNYPLGPFDQAHKIGLKNIINLLDVLSEETGEKRYRVSQLLREEGQKC